uniref:PHD-type domain-containing protein n=1 Tax=Rhabditophanes sp. KR3021 TaxID=114890 RepID=A0AC35UAD7_9BILA
MSDNEKDTYQDEDSQDDSQADETATQSDGGERKGVEPTSVKKSSSSVGLSKHKKGRRNNYDTVAEVIAKHSINAPDIDYSDADFNGITTFKQYQHKFKGTINRANPKLNAAKSLSLSSAMHRDFLKKKDDHFGVVKDTESVNQEEEEEEVMEVDPVPEVIPETVSQKKEKSKSKEKTVPPLRIRKNPPKAKPKPKKNESSDEEFENLLDAQERAFDEAEKDREERKQERLKKMADKKAEKEAARYKKPKPENIEHNEYCDTCKDYGELLLCDMCPRGYHLPCIDPDLKEAPEGDWMCALCVDAAAEEEALMNSKRKHVCEVCSETEYLLYCSNCIYSYHAYCLSPPLETLPEKNFMCPRCECSMPSHKPEKLLSWKFVETEYPEPWKASELPPIDTSDPENELKRKMVTHLRPSKKMAPRKTKLFFIKWRYLSYWHSDWIDEMVLDVHFAQVLRMYWRRNDPNIPPIHEMDDLEEEEKMIRKKKKDDPLNLYDRFYKYGVKPNWLVVQRVLKHANYKSNDYDYLVKWSEMAYDYSTWERDDFDCPGYETAIIKYWSHREKMTKEKPPKHITKRIGELRVESGVTLEEETSKKKKKNGYDIKKKHEVQPEYITETGGNLHPYQLEGINWLRHCYSIGSHAILADEMGLGKTVQAMTFLYSLYKEGASKGPFLVAAPLSTLLNWEREAHFWCPDFYCVTYVGDKEARAVIREHEFSFDEDSVRSGPKATKMKDPQNVKFHCLLTSYELINMDRAILSSIEWGTLVVDEAHRLKNNQSVFFKNLKDYNINYRLLLTGTPLQNNLEELFHLLNFLCPDTFDELEQFTKEFAEISKEDQIQKLHSMLGPHMLRRLKADVLTGMPTKSELIVPIDLAPMQKKWYKNILTKNFEALNIKNGGNALSLSNILMELKKCCNHPFLFPKASYEAEKMPNDLYEINGLVKASGKLVVMHKMMRKLHTNGHRVLIFSQMTKMLDILEDFCVGESYRFERIDGSITGQLRQEAIDRFNNPKSKTFVFLLSTRAGGLGINLATADTVIIYDSDWNPHNDIQAFSRAHRLGQKNTVMVYRFVTRNSVEERVTSVAKKKMLLTHLVVRANSGQKEPTMSKTELDDVLRWGTEELFKEDETAEDGETKPSENAIVWDDEAIDKLLYRKAFDPNEKIEEKKDWSDEYLSTFKVATYATTELAEEEEEENREVLIDEVQKTDPDYWSKLLRHRYEQDQEVELQQLGKGKRVRKQVNYAANASAQDWQQSSIINEDDDTSQLMSEEGDLSDGSDEETVTDAKKKRKMDEKLAPLLSKVNGQIEVLGFNPKQRKAFHNVIMRWGMPPSDAYQQQWLGRGLRSKSEKAYKAYSALFLRHLCEPTTESQENFSDGTPREGLNRQVVLSRIGLMALVRRKVQEFEDLNGDWSIPESKDIFVEVLGDSQLTQPDESLSQCGDESIMDCSVVNESKVEDVDIKTDEPKEPTETTEDALVIAKEEPKMVERPKCYFNIADGGFTELHGLWDKEEALTGPGKEYEFWHRRHDFWLLTGICTHGYGRYTDIVNDPKYAIINRPFEHNQTLGKNQPNAAEFKNKYLQKRYKLLESALIAEEQLKRAMYLEITQPNEEGLYNLNSHFSEAENVFESNREVLADAVGGDPNARAIATKALKDLDDMLSEMKNDLARLQPTVTRIKSVTERLHMTEREILSRLIAKEDEEVKRKPLPPAGPFVTFSKNQKLPSIQPDFPALRKKILGENEEEVVVVNSVESMTCDSNDSTAIKTEQPAPDSVPSSQSSQEPETAMETDEQTPASQQPSQESMDVDEQENEGTK